MKIIGLDNKEYSSVEECQAADAKFEEAKKQRELAEAEKKSAVSKRKKELSDKVAESDKAVEEAYKNYETQREKAAAIVEEADKKAKEILREAAKVVEAATEKRMNDIIAFNKEFGPYMTSYVGDRALDEYNKVVRKMRDIFTHNGFWLF